MDTNTIGIEVAFEKLKIKLKAMSINKSNHGKQIKIQI
jgi:hypothetical protein